LPYPSWPFLIVLGVSLAGGAAREAASAEPGAPATGERQQTALNRVQALDYAILPGGSILIKLTFQHELLEPPAVLTSYHPTVHIALDFAGTVSEIGKDRLEVNRRGLRSLQLIQAGTRTRLFIRLVSPHAYETDWKGKELLITLRRPSAATRSEVNSWVSGDAPEATHSLRNVTFQQGDAGAGKVVIELSGTTVPIDVRRQGNAVIVNFLDSALPPHLERRLDVRDFAAVVKEIETYRVGNGVRMKIELEGTGEYSAYQVGRHFVVAPRAPMRNEPATSRIAC
jgi:type IV pilus assembly protein PilQ